MTGHLVVSRVFLWSVLLIFPISVSAQQLEIHYINVNWGASVLVKGPNGTTVLLEAGNTGKGKNATTGYPIPAGGGTAWAGEGKDGGAR